MQQFDQRQQAFFLYHNMLSALFPAALADKPVADLLRDRIGNDMPHQLGLMLKDVLDHIKEFQDDFSREG